MAELPEGFDLDALLAPVNDETPAGADLREDFSPASPYFRLRDARAEARAAERQLDAPRGEDEGGGPSRNELETQASRGWRTIRSEAAKALLASKDLEIAAWYTEALVRSDSLGGLSAGCRLMSGMAERYWDTIFPRPDEDGIATTVAPVTGLNGEGGEGTLIQPLRKTVLFLLPDGQPLSLWQYEASADVATIADEERRQARYALGTLPFEDAESAARSAGAAQHAAVRAAAEDALAAWTALEAVMTEKAGADAPPSGRVRDVLNKIIEVAAKYGPAVATDAGAEGEPGAGGEAGGVAVAMPAGVAVAGPGRIASREDALKALEAIAEYFMKTEPHSPLAYTLQDAARRGRMSLPDLLAEVLPDSSTRAGFLTMLGIKPPEPE